MSGFDLIKTIKNRWSGRALGMASNTLYMSSPKVVFLSLINKLFIFIYIFSLIFQYLFLYLFIRFLYFQSFSIFVPLFIYSFLFNDQFSIKFFKKCDISPSRKTLVQRKYLFS